MDSNEFDVRRTVVSVLEQCAQCSQQYSTDDATVIERQGELWVLSVHCSHCDAQAFVAAVVDGATADIETSSHPDVGIVEMVEDEVDARVTVDDVLDLHAFLETFDGDFARMFGRKR
jgi:hypothetical protein